MQYELQIYPPDGIGGYARGVFKSDQPFMTIQKGDLIDPHSWNEHWKQISEPTTECPHGTILRVIGLEHRIQQKPDETITCHTIMVFTKAVDDVEESRP